MELLLPDKYMRKTVTSTTELSASSLDEIEPKVELGGIAAFPFTASSSLSPAINVMQASTPGEAGKSDATEAAPGGSQWSSSDQLMERVFKNMSPNVSNFVGWVEGLLGSVADKSWQNCRVWNLGSHRESQEEKEK